jgi:hypothetical protein
MRLDAHWTHRFESRQRALLEEPSVYGHVDLVGRPTPAAGARGA